MPYVMLTGLILMLVGVPLWMYRSEKKKVEAGCCGKPWISYCRDSQGGIGLNCQECDNGTWVSYYRKGFVEGEQQPF